MATGAVASQFLETYRGRDKIYRLISYFSQFVAGGLHRAGRAEAAKRLDALGSALSACRVVLRLGDDLAMWQVTKAFGLGAEVRHPVLRVLGVLQNSFDQLYYPLEHVAWACDAGILNRPSGKWWVASVAFWAGSLLTAIITTLIKLTQLNLAIAQARRRSSFTESNGAEQAMTSSGDEDDDEEDDDDDDDNDSRHGASFTTGTASSGNGKDKDMPSSRLLRQRRRGDGGGESSSQHHHRRRQPPVHLLQPSMETQRRQLLLQLVQNAVDLINAVHWMPSGFLWAGKLSGLAVGFNGVVSSLVGLYLILQRYRQQQSAQQDL